MIKIDIPLLFPKKRATQVRPMRTSLRSRSHRHSCHLLFFFPFLRTPPSPNYDVYLLTTDLWTLRVHSHDCFNLSTEGRSVNPRFIFTIACDRLTVSARQTPPRRSEGPIALSLGLKHRHRRTAGCHSSDNAITHENNPLMFVGCYTMSNGSLASSGLLNPFYFGRH